ncbi:MAG: cell division protein FtsZ [Bdellovibrionales bacterium]
MINLSMADPENMLRPRITVIGVGGGGTNAINNMISSNLEGCDFVAANTDAQALSLSLAERKIQLGANLSRGLGAGSKPDVGRSAAEETMADIMSVLEGSDMLFVTAGMGGGTGTGAAPVIARAARESGILTVGVVTKPFHFEGTHRMRQAEGGIEELQKYVDTLIVIPNQNLFRIANERTTFAEAFRLADEVLHSGVRGITDLMVMPGFMNLDFADVKTVMGEMGKAMMGTGEAEGENRAICAAEAAISNPLLDDISMKGARGVLINITGGMDMTLFEVDQAANRIREEVDAEAQTKVGSTLGENMDGRIRVSVIATGIDADEAIARGAAGRTEEGRRLTTTTATATATQHVAPLMSEKIEKSPVRVMETAPSKKASPVTAKAPVQKQSPAPAQAKTTVAGNPANYFSMPASVTPKTMTQKMADPVASSSTVSVNASSMSKASQEKPMVRPLSSQQDIRSSTAQIPDRSERDEEILEVVEQVEVAPKTVKVLPVREIQPVVQQAERQRTAPAGRAHDRVDDDDMRVTQLTASSSKSGKTIASRSQSLFQRITGFGLIRPSAQEDDLDEEEDVGQEIDREAQAAVDAKLGVEPEDRSVSSSNNEADQLDIPAFLRRQSNH